MNKDKRITQEEFIEFLTESWTCAFRNLAKNVSHSGNDGEFQGINNLQNDNLATMVENFGTANRDAMVKKSIDEFGKFDLDKNGYWDFQDFKEWLKKSQNSNIQVAYEHYKVMVPLHLNMMA